MSEVKFSRGPWVIERKGIIGPKITEDNQSNGMVSEICDVSCCVENKQANAHLIAAAPDLYEALENVLHEVKSCIRDEEHYFGSTERFDIARAALAKARGETP